MQCVIACELLHIHMPHTCHMAHSLHGCARNVVALAGVTSATWTRTEEPGFAQARGGVGGLQGGMVSGEW